ncbi:hypothetical protein AZ928_09720 [Salmonella enterica]|uniref:DUF7167 domain-containing protein n=2 Tax=Salmonella enterica TaxID=28901 RepID=A0A5U1N0J6_SALER|nr:hypothetical protein [Salmonella enterica]EAA7935422.1 hypothetical protein [Salmonella enterica subsp. enterica serovar Teko]EAB5413457.1 hypothetical protein [Salmonella enterica subsp. enterica serovar Paratyphi C]EBS4191526.1 hypothetical protein [Salmonella enterica subsp. enterica serovar Mbandaka]EBV3064735.1 hypothetical protein [Salmonella enterica subsp. enterica serovar Veneziana]ECA4076906.1 hypothetical protein [Salmonella enterica subsp. enterica serovar Braenderup]ECB3476585
MGRKFKVWLDSGANIHSCYKQEIDIEEYLGIFDDEWDSYSEEAKDEIMRDIAWEKMDWGFEEIESE